MLKKKSSSHVSEKRTSSPLAPSPQQQQPNFGYANLYIPPPPPQQQQQQQQQPAYFSLANAPVNAYIPQPQQQYSYQAPLAERQAIPFASHPSAPPMVKVASSSSSSSSPSHGNKPSSAAMPPKTKSAKDSSSSSLVPSNAAPTTLPMRRRGSTGAVLASAPPKASKLATAPASSLREASKKQYKTQEQSRLELHDADDNNNNDDLYQKKNAQEVDAPVAKTKTAAASVSTSNAKHSKSAEAGVFGSLSSGSIGASASKIASSPTPLLDKVGDIIHEQQHEEEAKAKKERKKKKHASNDDEDNDDGDDEGRVSHKKKMAKSKKSLWGDDALATVAKKAPAIQQQQQQNVFASKGFSPPSRPQMQQQQNEVDDALYDSADERSGNENADDDWMSSKSNVLKAQSVQQAAGAGISKNLGQRGRSSSVSVPPPPSVPTPPPPPPVPVAVPTTATTTPQWLIDVQSDYDVQFTQEWVRILLENEIDRGSFFLLTDKTLTELGLPLGARLKILQVIESEKKKNRLAAEAAAAGRYGGRGGSAGWNQSEIDFPGASSDVAPSNAVDEASQKVMETLLLKFPRNLVVQPQDLVIHHDAQIGRGGFGTVVEGRLGGRPVAVKLFDDVECGIEECLCTAGLYHKNIVSLLAVTVCPNRGRAGGGTLGGSSGGAINLAPRPRLAMVMELAEASLLQLLQSSSGTTLDFDLITRYVIQVAQALAFLHSRQPMVLHLDLKPANLLLANDLTTVKLCDFGISKETERTRTTMTHVMGTPLYMCEQQFRLGSKMDPSFDCYSFGAVLSYLISGEEPYGGRLQSFMGADGRVQPLVELLKPRKECPEFLVRICKECLCPDPAKRPKNGEMLLKMVLEGCQSFAPSLVTGIQNPTVRSGGNISSQSNKDNNNNNNNEREIDQKNRVAGSSSSSLPSSGEAGSSSTGRGVASEFSKRSAGSSDTTTSQKSGATEVISFDNMTF